MSFLCLSDRTCTVLNVEGDAFGAGILQFVSDRSSKKGEEELNEIRLGDQSTSAPEHSPLIEKRGADGHSKATSNEKESDM